MVDIINIGEKMLKKLTAMKARQNLGLIMNEVSIKGDDYIIERAGKPLVAVISMDKYCIIERERQKARQSLGKVWDKMKDEKPELIEKAILEAVQSDRNLK